MTVTKARNRIANKNTGGNKKQGLVPSTGKSNNIRSKQLYKAASNDKTVYCINQVGGIGRNRSVFKIGDSANCLKIYTLQNAFDDAIALVKLTNKKIATILMDTPYGKYLIIYNSADSPYILSYYSYHTYTGDFDITMYKGSYSNDFNDISSNDINAIKEYKSTNNTVPDPADNPIGFDLSQNFCKYIPLSNNDYNLYLNQNLFIHVRLDYPDNPDAVLDDEYNNAITTTIIEEADLFYTDPNNTNNDPESTDVKEHFFFALYPDEHLVSYSNTNYPVVNMSFSLGTVDSVKSDDTDITSAVTAFKPNFVGEDKFIDLSLNASVGYFSYPLSSVDYFVKLFEMNHKLFDNHKLHSNFYVTISSYTYTYTS